MSPTRLRAARLRPAFPYVVGLVVAAALYYAADHIAYTPRGSELGPDLWPKAAIGLMAIVCLVEIARALAGAGATRAVTELLAQEDEASAPPHAALLVGGIVLIGGYAVLMPILGFLLATLVFMALFMALGRYRNYVAIAAVSVLATGLIAFLFLRFAYVSLPRGVPPFDRFTDWIRIIVGG
jgi:putative tricarboxylic transport membrane protein